MRSSAIACAAGLVAIASTPRGRANSSRPPPATSRSRPSRAGSIIPGDSPSCPTAACWSPSGRGACASSARTASSRRRSPACRRCSRRARAACSTSCSTAATRRTTRSISAMPSRRTAARAPRSRARAGRRRHAPARRRQGRSSARRARSRPADISAAASCRPRDGNLFLSMGDHGSFPDEAQNLGNHIGKIIRIRPDGSVPPDNPFVGRARRKAGNLELRPPQFAGPGAASRDRQAVGARARAARRRRDQHHREGQELRLAGDRLRHRLQRRQDPRGHAEGRHGAAGLALGAFDRAVRDRPSTPATCSRPGAATCSRERWPARRWCGSSSTARRW